MYEVNWDADDVPSWAAFAARDADGRWFWYSTKPFANGNIGKWVTRNCTAKALRWRDATPADDWKHTLCMRPHEQPNNQAHLRERA